MQTGDRASRSFTVTDQHTAVSVGSGSLSVLATPVLLAWCESATCAALEEAPGGLPAGSTSVGTRVQLDHLVASAVGAEVRVEATVSHVDGRLARFEVVARGTGADGVERLLAHGEVTRVVVDRQRFLARLA